MTIGDSHIVKEWVSNTWQEKGYEAIAQLIPDSENEVLYRTSDVGPSISRSKIKNHQIIVNYNICKRYYLVYNAAIQKYIHKSNPIHISPGSIVKKRLAQCIEADSISFVFQDIKGDGDDQVELVLVVGENAIEQFCKSYKELIFPDANQIPKGKTCIYADAGGEIQRIRSTQE